MGAERVIVLDTHVWIWWMDERSRLRPTVLERIDGETDIQILAISMLEIATATSLNRLSLKPSADRWFEVAQAVEHVRIIPLTGVICLESTRLPGTFHRDPADRLIVALARTLDTELVTADRKILDYVGVRTIAAV